MKDETIVLITCVGSATIGFVYAMHKGVDTVVVGAFFTFLGTVIGYYAKRKRG